MKIFMDPVQEFFTGTGDGLLLNARPFIISRALFGRSGLPAGVTFFARPNRSPALENLQREADRQGMLCRLACRVLWDSGRRQQQPRTHAFSTSPFQVITAFMTWK